ncbi:hypothetical protein Agub_g9634 [Astrephomene gubernaculifera]|uniref:PPM-type phosphatase domain-containing protein n=1 Tax=Astrephomene gubernaculifera TaxID=47775 RepID=A0AAD3DXZ6_9CHLO|nr:hypothetical protein Agub_g9634 [Astrephomene gubernaculifera]
MPSSLMAGSSACALSMQLAPNQLRLALHRRGRGPQSPPCSVVASAQTTVSANGKRTSTRPLPRTQEELQLAAGILGTVRKSIKGSTTMPCDLLLVTSWEESSIEQTIEDETCIEDWIQGAGVSPTSISQGFATSKGPLKPTMQDYFVAVSDSLGALWALSPATWRTSSASSTSSVHSHPHRQHHHHPHLPHHASSAPFCLTAVFDGHGAGDHAARSAQEGVLAAVAGDGELLDYLADSLQQPGVSPGPLAAVTAALRRTFRDMDERICAEAEARKLPHDGTTALLSLQVGPKLFTANAGDCRALLCRDGAATRLSRDHSPDLPTERRRIEAASGRVACVRGTWRVVLPVGDGSSAKVCAVSRGFGDRDFKSPARLISPDPEVSAVQLAPRRDTFLLHASDGLWCCVGDQEAVERVQRVVDKFSVMTSLATRKQHAAAAKAAAQELVQLARDRGSLDDITVIVTLFDWE